jgi:DNA-binding LytR/AlgR family response regulator
MTYFIIDDDAPMRLLLASLLQELSHLELAGSYGDPIEAIPFLIEKKPDLLFLDVEMPKMSGVEFAETLDPSTKVIFISSRKDYAVDAFNLNAIDYILKPFTLARLSKAVMKANKTKILPTSTDLFIKTTNQSYERVVKNEILYIEALGDYVQLYTANKRFVMNGTLKNAVEQLENDDFLRIHRSYLVNLNKIDKIDDSTVVIQGKVIPIGRSFKKEFLAKIQMLDL